MSSYSSPIKYSSTSNSRVRLGRGIVPVPGSRKLCPIHALAHHHRLQAARMTKGCGGCCSCKSKHVLHLSHCPPSHCIGPQHCPHKRRWWATANIRSMYNSLSASGHHVLLVAPPNQPSGVGGTFVLPVNKSLYKAADFNYIPKGAPSWGHEPNNSMIWYLDGSPSACAIYAEDVLAPKYLPGGKVDLLVAGPNEGDNQGSAGFPQSGTIGAAYTSINKGIPGIEILNITRCTPLLWEYHFIHGSCYPHSQSVSPSYRQLKCEVQWHKYNDLATGNWAECELPTVDRPL